MSRVSLRAMASVYLAAWTVHTFDHARRGLDATSDGVVWAGTVIGLLTAVTLTLVFTRHPAAPMLSLATGVGVMVGVSASHLLPAWGALSDSLPDGNVDWFTWLAVVGEIAAAALMAAAAWRITKANQFSAHIPAWR